MAVEILDDGRKGNMDKEHIENFKSDTLKYAIKDCITDDARIKSDKFHSYKKLEKELPNLQTVHSGKVKAWMFCINKLCNLKIG